MGRSREGSNRRAVGARRNQLRRVTGPPLVTASSLVRSVHGCRGAGLLLPPSRARTRPLLEAFYAPRRCCLRRGHSSGSRTRCSLSSTFEPQGTRRLPAELLEAPSRVAGRIGDEASRSAAAFRCALALSLGSGSSGRKPVGGQVHPWSLGVTTYKIRRYRGEPGISFRSPFAALAAKVNKQLTKRSRTSRLPPLGARASRGMPIYRSAGAGQCDKARITRRDTVAAFFAPCPNGAIRGAIVAAHRPPRWQEGRLERMIDGAIQASATGAHAGMA